MLSLFHQTQVHYSGSVKSWKKLDVVFECKVQCNGCTAPYIGKVRVENGTLIIPYNETEIADNAFKNRTDFTRVIIGKNVTSIGSSAFSDCRGLTSIVGSANVSSVVAKQARASSYSVTITSGTNISENAFKDGSGLTSIQFKGTKKQWKAIEKGYDWKYEVKHFLAIECTDGLVREL